MSFLVSHDLSGWTSHRLGPGAPLTIGAIPEQSEAALDSSPGTVSHAVEEEPTTTNEPEAVDTRVPWYRRRKGNSFLVPGLSGWASPQASPRPASPTNSVASGQSGALFFDPSTLIYGSIEEPTTRNEPEPVDTRVPWYRRRKGNSFLVPVLSGWTSAPASPRPASPTNSIASGQSGAAHDSSPGTVSYAVIEEPTTTNALEPVDARVPWYWRKGKIGAVSYSRREEPTTTNEILGNRENSKNSMLPLRASLTTPPPTAERGPLRSFGPTQPLISRTRAAPTPLTANARATAHLPAVSLGGAGAPATSAFAQSAFVSLTPSRSRSPPVFPERVGGHKSDGDGALTPASAWWGNLKRQRTNTIEQAEGYTQTRSVRPFLSTSFTNTQAP